MNSTDLIAALDLPAASRVDRRVPKTLLLEHGAPTPADKRHISERIDELQWVAALKPTTIGVPEYRDDLREYLEIAVLRLTLRAEGEAPAARSDLRSATAQRVIELVHRAVPYPVILVTEHDQGRRVGLSVAHKRWSQGESGKTVLDGEVVAVEWDGSEAVPWAAVAQALALGRQPRTTMYALYQGWRDTLIAVQAARVTGAFSDAASPGHAADRLEALRECGRLDAEITRVRAAAAKEKQVARQVELNLALKRLEVTKAAACARL